MSVISLSKMGVTVVMKEVVGEVFPENAKRIRSDFSVSDAFRSDIFESICSIISESSDESSKFFIGVFIRKHPANPS